MRKMIVLALALTSCSPSLAPPSRQPSTAPLVSPQYWLAAHNRERASFGVPPLTWDPQLAAQAIVYAGELARIGRLQHSPKARRPGQGENLWIGSRGAYSPAAKTESWSNERRLFRHGVFPANSRTGNWAAVGHLTQMVWPTTTRLGCGLASSPRWDVLVCRYSPPGNRDGVRI
ncbi:MAG: CAP family protein [Sphingomicrobium sp.]